MVVSRWLALVLFVTASAPAVFAQRSPQRVVSPSTNLEAANCTPGYAPTFGAFPGADNTVWAACVFDDGSGPALYVGGEFLSIAGVDARGLAKWDGTSWSALPDVNGGIVLSFEVWDDGNGPALYVGGLFRLQGVFEGVARWDGATWQTLGSGTNGLVRALTVFDDGAGPELIAGGSFTSPSSCIASWNGASWNALGSGTDNSVRALEVWNTAAGDVLYAGGDFFTAGGVPSARIASWDGSTWSQLAPLNQRVHALEVWDDGTGPALYVGGDFTNAAGVPLTAHLARWDGTAWSSVSAGVTNPVHALVAGDDLAGGSGLWVGAVSGSTIVQGLALWNGVSWIHPGPGTSGRVYSIAIFDDGNGPRLWAGGAFDTSVLNKNILASNNIAIWDGAAWSLITDGLDAPVAELFTFDDGSGSSLFAAGGFEIGGNQPLFGIGRWDGSTWHTLGSGSDDGVGDIFTFGSADLGAGPVLFVGGSVRDIDGVDVLGVAQWDGVSWSALGQGVGANASIAGPFVGALVGFDDGSGEKLFVGGEFSPVTGGPALNVAQWDGDTWFDVGGGVDDAVLDFLPFDDGSGMALFACGRFTTAGGVPASHVARWDGASWAPLGAGVPSSASSFAVLDDGAGPRIHVSTNKKVFRWDGATWQQLGTDIGLTNDFVSDLAVYDDGTGPSLYASGDFVWIDGAFVYNLARWDGSAWLSVGNGTSDRVYSLHVHDTGDGSGPGLYVGSTPSIPGQDGLDSFLFRWTDACDPPTFYCTPKTSSAGCQATLATSAASQPISGAGDYEVLALNAQSFKPGILLAGISGQAAIPFFGGVLCLQPPWKRGPFVSSGGSGANTCTGVLATVVNSGIILPGGLDAGPGNSVWHQYWYRDPQNGAGGFGTALSDAVQLDYR